MLEVNGAVLRPLQLTIEDLQAHYQPHTTAIFYRNDVRRIDATFTGVRLWDILQIAKVEPGNDLRIRARAGDRFRCLIRWREVDPSLGESRILVAYAQDGQPLSEKDGPLRLVVPGDERGLRYLRGLATLTVLNGGQHDDEIEVKPTNE